MRRLLDRRTLLRGALGGTAAVVGLPLLDAMLSPRAWAANEGFPCRFGLWFWGNGTLPGDPDDPVGNPDRWTPQGTGLGNAWTLSEQLAPLAPHKDVLAVVTGLSMKLPNTYPHGSGAAGVLSGASLANDQLHSFTAPTIDQIIAAAIGKETLYTSLQTAATETVGLSFSGPNALHPCETSPFALYQRLFGDTFVVPGEGGLVSPTLGLRRSVLDAVTGDLSTLQIALGPSDRSRLDQHLTGVRELEGRLARLELDPPNLEACDRPTMPAESYPNVGDLAQVGPRNQAMAELLAMALACDQTRTFAHFLTEPIHNTRFSGTSDGHHNLTHDELDPQTQVNAITIQCMEFYAAFLTALRNVPEGGGTLLDSTIVLGLSETSYGRVHSKDEMPIVIAGSGGGKILQNIHARSTNQDNVSKVMLTVLRAMGVVAASFGTNEAEVTDGFSAIEV